MPEISTLGFNVVSGAGALQSFVFTLFSDVFYQTGSAGAHITGCIMSADRGKSLIIARYNGKCPNISIFFLNLVLIATIVVCEN